MRNLAYSTMLASSTMHYLDRALQQAAQRLWPDIEIPPADCRPLLDSSLGDVGSSLSLQLAKFLKLEPSEVAKLILKELPSDLPFLVVLTEGFINFRLTVSALLERQDADFHSQNQSSSHLVCAVPPKQFSAPGAFLRLSHASLMQAGLLFDLNQAVDFQLGSKHFGASQFSRCQSLFKAIQSEIIEQTVAPTSSSKDWPKIFEEILSSETVQRYDSVHLWASSPLWSRAKYTDIEAKLGGKLNLYYPPKSWLSGLGPSFLNGIKEKSHELDAALMVYLCSAERATELDFEIVKLNSCRNLLWYISSSLHRIERFVAPPLLQTKCDLSIEMGSKLDLSELRDLLVKLALFPEFQKRAALKGEVLDLHICLEHLLDRFNRFFNCPRLRLKLEQEELSEQESLVITECYHVLKAYHQLFS